MAVKKPETKVIDREAQRKDWFNQFFDSNVIKIIGIAWLFIFILLFVFSVCLITNHSGHADNIWVLTETLTKLTFGAMFSAVGIKVESTI